MAREDKTAMIPPITLGGEVRSIPISSIKSPVIAEKSVELERAIVGYFDILGFASKTHWRDMELCLLDFSGPLLLTAHEYRALRVNVFSDCAFVSAPYSEMRSFLGGIRYAFGQWIADGLLVRGGISIGSYNETKASHIDASPENFVGNLFGGSGVSRAVHNEKGGVGALLFTDESTAETVQQELGESVFRLGDGRIAFGWGSDPKAMYWFVGVSFIRLLLALRAEGPDERMAAKLRTNIIYGVNVSEELHGRFIVSAICSSDIPEDEAEVQRALQFIGLPDERDAFSDPIRTWLQEDNGLLKAIALMDSSVNPDMSIWEKMSQPKDATDG